MSSYGDFIKNIRLSFLYIDCLDFILGILILLQFDIKKDSNAGLGSIPELELELIPIPIPIPGIGIAKELTKRNWNWNWN